MFQLASFFCDAESYSQPLVAFFAQVSHQVKIGWMDRAELQLALTGFAGLAAQGGWHYYLQHLAAKLGSELAVSQAKWLVKPLLDDPLFSLGWDQAFALGSLLLLCDSGPLVWECLSVGVRIVLRVSVYLLRGIEWLLHVLCWVCGACAWVAYCALRGGLPCYQTERRALTCNSMAALVAGGGVPFQIGSFALVSRPPDYDEVWVAGHGPSPGQVLVRTTTEDGSDWMWAVILPVAGEMMAPTLVGENRRPPHGVQPTRVNWLCVPPNAEEKWRPSHAESMQLIRDATQMLGQLQAAGANSYVVNSAGVAGKLEAVQTPVPAVGGGVPNMGALGPAALPAGQGGVGGAAGSGSPAVAALGLPDSGGQGSGNVDLKALEAAVAQLKALSLSDSKSKKDRKKDRGGSKKGKKSEKKDKKKRSKKKKKKKSSSSSSSSSRSRSRASSSSSSRSSSGSSGKPLRWREHGRDKKVSYTDMAHVDSLKWKKKGDLVAFAAKHPGALTAHFLAGVYARLSKGTLSRTGQLREASVTAWAHQFTGLTEIRDMKEVLTLAEILDAVNRREIARALDILCQRILAIQSAKLKGGSWEKAEAIELVNTQKTLASSGMLALTNA